LVPTGKGFFCEVVVLFFFFGGVWFKKKKKQKNQIRLPPLPPPGWVGWWGFKLEKLLFAVKTKNPGGPPKKAKRIPQKKSKISGEPTNPQKKGHTHHLTFHTPSPQVGKKNGFSPTPVNLPVCFLCGGKEAPNPKAPPKNKPGGGGK